MAEFNYHTEETAPESSKGILSAAKQSSGFIPNLYAVMAEAPGLLEAYKTVGDLFQNSSFDSDELTVVWQSINVEHDCHYCVPAHTLIANMMKVDPAIVQALRDEKALPNERLEALRSFSLSVVRNRGVVDDKNVQEFLDAGFTKRHILEVVLGVAQKVMSNYTNHLAQTKLDTQFEQFKWENKT